MKRNGARAALTGIRGRVALLLLLAIVPTGLLTVVNARNDLGEHLRTTHTELDRLADLAVSQQRQLVGVTQAVLTALARAPEVAAGSRTECSAYLAGALPDFALYDNLGVIDRSGIVRCSAVPATGLVDVSDRSYFQLALRADAFASGSYQVGRITGATSVNFGLPIHGEHGRVTGVVFAALDVGWLNAFIARFQLPAGAVLTIFDPGGTVIARYPDPAHIVGSEEAKTALFSAARSTPSSVAEVVGVDGVRRTYAFGALDGPSGPIAYLTVGIANTVLYGEAGKELRHDLLVLAVVAALALSIGTVLSSRLVVHPVRHLTRAADRMAGGDLDVRVHPDARTGELATLASSFNLMAESLSTRTRQLGESVRRLHNLHEIDRAIIAASSPEEIARNALEGLRSVVAFDRAAVHLFDYDARTATILTVVEDEVLGAPAGSVIGFEDIADVDQLEAEEVLFMDEFTRSGDPSPLVEEMKTKGVATAVTIPLRRGARVIGRLAISSKVGAFPPGDVTTALQIADQLAIALSSARMREDLAGLATELEARIEDLRRTDTQRRQLLGRLVRAQEEERRRIAEDIHDDSVQAMVAAALRLGTVRLRTTNEEARELLEGVEGSVGGAIDRLRNLLFELSPQFLERDGVVVALRRYAREAFAQDGADVVIDSDLVQEPPYEVQFVVYRTVQAALGNVRTHARARRVCVEIRGQETGLRVRVIDDGVGFDVAQQAERPGHLGISAMRQRVELAGGWLHVDSSEGDGTTVEFFVPRARVRTAV
jgi:signal transduction histidine kinase